MTRTVPAALAGSQMAYNIMYNIMYNIKQFKTIRNNLFLYCQILFYIVCNIVYNMKQYALQYEKTCTINWNSRNFSSNITIFIKIFTIYFQYCNIVFNIVILYKYCLKNCASFNNLLLDWITIFNFSRQFWSYIVECFLKLPTIWLTILGCRWFANVWNFECRAVGDAQFWVDIRSAVDPERTSEFVETYLECPSAPKSSDPERWPVSWAKTADDCELEGRIDAVLAGTLSKTEIMVLNFYQEMVSRARKQMRETAIIGDGCLIY